MILRDPKKGCGLNQIIRNRTGIGRILSSLLSSTSSPTLLSSSSTSTIESSFLLFLVFGRDLE